jgi:hypothetical protein
MKEKIKKGDLVVWDSSAEFDLVTDSFEEGSEQIGIVIEITSLKNVIEEDIQGARVKWYEYPEPFWTPVDMIKILSITI